MAYFLDWNKPENYRVAYNFIAEKNLKECFIGNKTDMGVGVINLIYSVLHHFASISEQEAHNRLGSNVELRS